MFDGTLKNFVQDETEISPVTKALIDAKGFLEKGWCCYVQGRDVNGAVVYGNDPRAVKWCLYGAMIAATPNRAMLDAAADIVTSLLPNHNIAEFNDTQKTVKPVLKVIDLAIAKSMEK